jgi:4-amino-4-deoxy-L-arabinose transferase-like glycosyltransferase
MMRQAIAKLALFAGAILLIVTVEATLILLGGQRERSEILGGDGTSYHQMALNLMERFEVSLSRFPPIEPTIYRSPGYPAFLALIYLVSDRSIMAVKITQFTLLGITALLLYQLATHHVGEQAAKLSAVLCATYPPLVFLSTFHLTESLATFGAVGLVLLIEKAGDSKKWKFPLNFAVGIVSGILTLIRPSLALSILFILSLGIISTMWSGKSANVKILDATLILAAMASGFMMILTPWLARNAVLSNRLILTSANSESLYCSTLQYSGRISYSFTSKDWQTVYFHELRKRREEVERRLNSEPSNQASPPHSIRAELLLSESWARGAVEESWSLTPWLILKSIPKRLAYLWSTCDMSPQWLQAGIFHRLVQGHFLVMALLALLGVFLRRKKLVQEWPLWIFPIYLSIVHLVFHIEPRYSVPARPFILVYSAVGGVAIFELIRTRTQKCQVGRIKFSDR